MNLSIVIQPASVRKIQLDILSAYEADIAKHAGKDTPKARLVFESIPSQLTKENKKFVFGALRKGARAAEYENAIQWLLSMPALSTKFPAFKGRAANIILYGQGYIQAVCTRCWLLGAMAQIPPL